MTICSVCSIQQDFMSYWNQLSLFWSLESTLLSFLASERLDRLRNQTMCCHRYCPLLWWSISCILGEAWISQSYQVFHKTHRTETWWVNEFAFIQSTWHRGAFYRKNLWIQWHRAARSLSRPAKDHSSLTRPKTGIKSHRTVIPSLTDQ